MSHNLNFSKGVLQGIIWGTSILESLEMSRPPLGTGHHPKNSETYEVFSCRTCLDPPPTLYQGLRTRLRVLGGLGRPM